MIEHICDACTYDVNQNVTCPTLYSLAFVKTAVCLDEVEILSLRIFMEARIEEADGFMRDITNSIN